MLRDTIRGVWAQYAREWHPVIVDRIAPGPEGAELVLVRAKPVGPQACGPVGLVLDQLHRHGCRVDL
eukprot:11648490-Alexandrium_andersonii.AAC.1